ncbi:MAG: class I SAM-dependent methyltransferase [Nocardioides sp.]|uniref:class I SAM-dependent methyltransferase n=1 Tax=Nocardioides sp. TaxID=35761 RepID=UPI0039E5C43C
MQAEHRQALAQLWAMGDYARLAERLRPAAGALAGALGEGHGRRALDLATGTGSVALALAADGWAVSAVDVCAPLLSQAREAADREDLVVDWREEPLEELPFRDETFAVVASSFGLIFTNDPSATLREVARCLRPDGILAFTAWTPAGYLGQMSALMARHLPQPGAATAPLRWGDAEQVAGLLGQAFAEVEIEVRTLPWRFASSEAAVDFYFTCSPAHIAAGAMLGPRADQMRTDLGDQLAALAHPGGSIDIDAEYLLVRAHRDC